MRLLRSLVITATLLLIGATAASAADICFRDITFTQDLVVKALILPTANNCKAVMGYKKDTLLVFSGTVCKTWDNTLFLFSLQFGFSGASLDGGSLVFWVDPTNAYKGWGTWLNWEHGPDKPGFTDVIQIEKRTCDSVRRFGPP